MAKIIDRRETLKYMTGGALTVSSLGVPGCLPMLLRLVVGRGTIGRMGTAARIGGAASTLTFGRGISVGSRLSGARVSRFPKTQIVDQNGKLIAQARSNKGEARVSINNSDVFYSRDTPYGQEHFHHYGPSGRSYNRDKNVIEHKDADGRRLGYDQLRFTKKVIDHMNSDFEKVGETRYTIEDSAAVIQPDEGVLQNIKQVEKLLGLNCPKTAEALNELIEAQKRCGSGETSYCSKIAMKTSRYKDLQRACNSSK